MKLSKKAYYGLRASLALVNTKEPVSIHTLAEQEHISEDYLEKILQELRRVGVVTAVRGTAGGYTLSKSDTTAWEVISALDGPLKMYPVRNDSQAKRSNSGGAPLRQNKKIEDILPCYQETHCQANALFRTLEDSFETTLKNISLASLTQNTRQ